MHPADDLVYDVPAADAVPDMDPEAMVDGIADAMGYDSEAIEYDALPEHIGGVTVPEMAYTPDGEIDIVDSFIQLNDSYLEEPVDYQQLRELQATTYHEIAHGKQFEEIAASDATYTDEEMEALLFAHEGQAVFNADGRAYPDGEAFYDEFYHMLQQDVEADEALEQLSDEYFTAVVALENGDGEGAYQLVMEDRDEIDDIDEDELYEEIADEYGMDVDLEATYEVDFRDDSLDSEKIGDHLLEVQDELEERYQAVAEEDYRLLPPAAADNLGFDAVEPEQAYQPVETPAMAME